VIGGRDLLALSPDQLVKVRGREISMIFQEPMTALDRKDAIRRRGENVSSFEIEREVLDHPDVNECAAIGVRSELGEEDIKVFVVRRPGSDLTAAALLEHVRARCAGFMVPRYVEFLEELPRTEATQKVKKSELSAREDQAAVLATPDQPPAGPTPRAER